MHSSRRDSLGPPAGVELLSGYLKKQGPPNRPNWKKRWIVLSAGGSDRRLSYYKKKPEDEKKRDKLLKGTVVLDPNSVLVLNASSQKKFEFSFAIKTPDRNYVFLANDAQDKEQWTSAILKVMAAIREDAKKGGSAQPVQPKPAPKPVTLSKASGVKATEPPPHFETLADTVEDDTPISRATRPRSVDLTNTPPTKPSGGPSAISTPSPQPSGGSRISAGGAGSSSTQPSVTSQPSSSSAFSSPSSSSSSSSGRDRADRERGGGGGSIFRKGGEGDMSDKPLLRTAESAGAVGGSVVVGGGAGSRIADRPKGDRGSSYNVVKDELNLIPDYSENFSDSEEDADIDYIQKKSSSSWWPSWCPCAGFQTLG